jgi:hypothetical protein
MTRMPSCVLGVFTALAASARVVPLQLAWAVPQSSARAVQRSFDVQSQGGGSWFAEHVKDNPGQCSPGALPSIWNERALQKCHVRPGYTLCT